MQESLYFKTKEDIVRYGISAIPVYETNNNCIPITEEEYNTAMAELEAKAQQEQEEAQQAEQTYIEQLEAENASLLYQLLTGEEYTDV